MIGGTQWGKKWAWRVIKPKHGADVVLKRSDRDPRKQYEMNSGLDYGVQWA